MPFYYFYYVLIGLMQLGTRCSDGFCEAAEDLISGFSAIEAEAELVQVRLKLCAATVIGSQQERFQVADGFVQPVQVAGYNTCAYPKDKSNRNNDRKLLCKGCC